GAGMDMRAFRIEGIDSLNVYELDSAAMSDYKQTIIRPLIGDNQHVTYLPINLKTESLQQNLNNAGCDSALKTFFIWEGQTQYLPEPQVKAVLNTIASFAKGSQFIFSYLLEEVIPEYSQEEIEENLVKWQFGLEPRKVKSFLVDNKLQLLEDLDSKAFEKRYIEPSERALSCLAVEHTALAQV
ncbi:MAG: class I SAM-dependent methyltransferase, partial [Psychromonas sp.]|nr:class I SAM-dependent methyltransferase [Psychromonas sp.]